MRKCNALIRTNTRQLDRDLARLKASDSLTRQHIVNASKRAPVSYTHLTLPTICSV